MCIYKSSFIVEFPGDAPPPPLRYCPPHIKRKRKMEEMAAIFSQPTQVPEFYSRLLLRDLKAVPTDTADDA